jgi:hypothetical protein
MIDGIKHIQEWPLDDKWATVLPAVIEQEITISFQVIGTMRIKRTLDPLMTTKFKTV